MERRFGSFLEVRSTSAQLILKLKRHVHEEIHLDICIPNSIGVVCKSMINYIPSERVEKKHSPIRLRQRPEKCMPLNTRVPMSHALIILIEKSSITDADAAPPLQNALLKLIFQRSAQKVMLTQASKPVGFILPESHTHETTPLIVELHDATKYDNKKPMHRVAVPIPDKAQVVRRVQIGGILVNLRTEVKFMAKDSRKEPPVNTKTTQQDAQKKDQQQQNASTPPQKQDSQTQKVHSSKSTQESPQVIQARTATLTHILSHLSTASQTFASRHDTTSSFPLHSYKPWNALLSEMRDIIANPDHSCSSSLSHSSATIAFVAHIYAALSLAQNSWILDAEDHLDLAEGHIKSHGKEVRKLGIQCLLNLAKGVLRAQQKRRDAAIRLLQEFQTQATTLFDSKLISTSLFKMEFQLADQWLVKFGSKPFHQIAPPALPRRVSATCVAPDFISDPNQTQTAMEKLNSMIGLKVVKRKIQEIANNIAQEARKQKFNPSYKPANMRNHMIFSGNPGTGKTTVAALVGQIFTDIGYLQKPDMAEISGFKLADMLGDDQEKWFLSAQGGVVFIDEAYQLDPLSHPGGKKAVNLLLKYAEEWSDTVFILAGYRDEMDRLLSFNQGMRSRFVHDIAFPDYDRDELRQIINYVLRDKQHHVETEQALDVVVNRYAQGIGTRNFGNARGIRNIVETSITRMNARIAALEKAGVNLTQRDYFTLSKEDLLGLSELPSNSKVLEQLDAMVGLDSVKRAFHDILDLVLRNRKREEEGGIPSYVPLHRVLLGGPGTGKTTVANLYARMLCELGLVEKDDVVVKDPSKFIGAVLGGSEENTNRILDESTGKVLFIDEAYGLNPNNEFAKKAVDTLVANVHGKSSDPCIVLMAGYKEEMLEFFRDTNPGLARRMQLEQAFEFEDYSDDDLEAILIRELVKQGRAMRRHEAHRVIEEYISRLRTKPKFGNAGEIQNAIARASQRATDRFHQKSQFYEYIAEDFLPEKSTARSVDDELSDMVGMKGIKDFISSLRLMARQAERDGENPVHLLQSFMCLRFEGPPGTGKTTCARLMGRVMEEFGVLATNRVVETSASDLQTGYVGQAGRTTRKVLDSALGGVLFIDEAYRLIPKGSDFNQEILDELCTLLTDPQYKGRLAIVLAGYPKDMDRLMRSNAGLASRFSEVVHFDALNAAESSALFVRLCSAKGYPLTDAARNTLEPQLHRVIAHKGEFWGSGRDVDKIFKTALKARAGRLMGSQGGQGGGKPPFDESDIVEACDHMLKGGGRATGAVHFDSDNVESAPPTMNAPSRNANKTIIDTDVARKQLNGKEQHADPSPETVSNFWADFQSVCISNGINVDKILRDFASADSIPTSVLEQFAALQNSSSVQVKQALQQQWSDLLAQHRRIVEKRKKYEERLCREEEERLRLEEEQRQLEVQRQQEEDEQKQKELEVELQRIVEEARKKKPCFYCGRPWDHCPFELDRRRQGIFMP